MKTGFFKWLALAICFSPNDGGGGGISRPDSISEDEWQGLSNEEREGVLMTGEGEQGHVLEDGDEGEGGELSAEELAAIAGTVVADTTVDDALAAATGTEVVTVADTSIVEDAGGETSTETATVSDDVLIAFRPVVKDSELPISTEVPAEMTTKLDALDAQYEADEISAKEYQAARDAINREIVVAQMGSRDEAREDKVWEKEQAFFYQNRPEYLAKDLKGTTMYGALEKAVGVIAQDPKFANASGMAILIEADRAVRALFGAPAPAPTKSAAATDKGKPPAARPDVKTLTAVPSANANDTGGDPFAALDRLVGEAYESALERLSPDQKAEYERRA